MILVTGGAGFIGSHLVDALLERGEDVACLDDFNDFYDPRSKRRNVEKHLQFEHYSLVEGDIRDTDLVSRVFRKYNPGKVIHLAARVGVRPSLEEPFLYLDVNVKGTLNILEHARKQSIRQLIFASSSSVYGSNAKVPFHEDDPIRQPVSPYAVTKVSGEHLCYTCHHLYGIPLTCLRFFTVYGPRQRPDMAIHKFARLLLRGEPIPVYGNGQTSRDYTYVGDIVDGLLAALDKPQPFEVFNLGESFSVTLNELISEMEKLSGHKAFVHRLPTQPGDVERTFADITKAQRLLGYKPKVSLTEGLRHFLEWVEPGLFR